jgi:hypothetical protein
MSGLDGFTVLALGPAALTAIGIASWSSTGRSDLGVHAAGTEQGSRVRVGRIALGDGDHGQVALGRRHALDDDLLIETLVRSRGEALNIGLAVDAQQDIGVGTLVRERIAIGGKSGADVIAVPVD